MRLVGAHEPGYWRADDHLAPGTDYAFSVDGGPALPDPCSTLLPQGLHGPSRVLDEDFTWHDHAWRGADLGRGVLLHVDVATFTTEGTLDAAAALLPQLARLGVDGVELAPVAAFDQRAGPEAGVRIFAVHEPYGGPYALQRFVDAAHQAGLAVVLDLPHRWAAADALGLHAFGPYAAGSRLGPRADAPGDDDAPRINLDASGSRGARDFLIADARRWLDEYHVDGLLLDVEALVDRSAVPFLAELADMAHDIGAQSGRPRTLLADGPGRSDRLTTAVHQILAQRGRAASVDVLRHLADSVFPPGTTPTRPPSARRRADRATARSASALVGDLTRLPAAARTVPWSHLQDAPAVARTPAADGTGIDDRAALLAFAILVGTPLVLDTEHVPVSEHDAGAERLVGWARHLLTLRPSSLADLAQPVELSSGPGVLVARRGSSALALVTALDPVEIELERHLTTPASSWRIAASWDRAGTHLLADRLQVPGRAVVVLRTDSEPTGDERG